MKLPTFNIGTRLALAFGAFIVLLAAILIWALTSLAQIQDSSTRIVEYHNTKVNAANVATNAIRDVAAFASNIAMLSDDTVMAAERDKLAAARNRYGAAKATLTSLTDDPDGKRLLDRLNAELAIAVPLNNKMIEMRLQHRNAEAIGYLMSTASPALRKTIAALDDIVAHETKVSAQVAEQAKARYLLTQKVLVLLGLVTLVLCCLIAWRITTSVKAPLKEALAIADAVAAGDVSADIVSHKDDETGRLLAALGKMNRSLNSIVGQVRSSATSVATAASEIAAGNRSLSERTEEQAASLEETASSMEELTGTVLKNAENARQASALASVAADISQRTGAVVADVVSTMSSINASSKRVVDIIAVIDAIAFQTNILALNAAVEAARAGEQGRGFAVVASEVRALAQRSAAAAKEIKQLIDASVTTAASGAQLVGSAGATMQELQDSVHKVKLIVADIALASAEQGAGIEQVNKAIAHMDQATQQNAALVEQASAGSEALKDQAAQLAQAVSIFRLADVALIDAAQVQGVETMPLRPASAVHDAAGEVY
ncbi:methyl-accepting chemotaxis protein [Herbaspirillum sp. VT-16-41]|uniref:methyl-accepting chemotaxis protein n=1 Tax=Herbaspirillum sp. VT-16-41 TaxID=1953765 RepID=UPI0009823B34|nr:methyl-accepting chemotaxis protein [Herbaspirillum sp. VT-16-41]ONN64885.1 methyl-accepting chemotaxis protein [Herbaspirillum sp. VT-16-41]